MVNMEIVFNVLWDGKLLFGDYICVVGGGVVGFLIVYVC